MPAGFPLGPLNIPQTGTNYLAGTLSVGMVGGAQTLNVGGNILLQLNSSSTVTPIIEWLGVNGDWQIGIDTANNGGGADLFVGRKNGASVTDTIFLTYRDGVKASLIGLGVTPPVATLGTSGYRIQMAASDSETALGTLAVRVGTGAGQTGLALVVHQSSGAVLVGIDVNGRLRGPSSTAADHDTAHINDAVAIQAANIADAATLYRTLSLICPDGTKTYGLVFSSTNGNSLRLRNLTGGTSLLDIDNSGAITTYGALKFGLGGGNMGFYGATPVAKQTVTGARSDGTALASLLTKLATVGLITDSSTA